MASDVASSSTSASRRGVPVAPFVENVAEFVGDQNVDTVIRGLEERLQQYRMVEVKLLTQLRDLQGKIPEIRKSLEVVRRMQKHHEEGSQGDIVADFEISEGIYTKASIQASSAVCLWLGANVMLEYPLTEALELLDTNQKNAKESIEALQGDVDFLRDQINTTEVTIARVHNWQVKQRRTRPSDS